MYAIRSYYGHIINGVNKELSSMFEGDNEKVMDYLEKNNLLDLA